MQQPLNPRRMGYLDHVKLLLLFSLICMLSLNRAEDEKKEERAPVCNTEVCRERASLIQEYMDASKDPCEDFYEYSCANWRKKHEDSQSYDAFTMTETKFIKELQTLLGGIDPKEENQKTIDKAGVLYKSCLAVPGTANGDSISDVMVTSGFPAWPITRKSRMREWVPKHYGDVISTTGISPIIHVYVAPGLTNVGSYVIQVYTPMFIISVPREVIKAALKHLDPTLVDCDLNVTITKLLEFQQKLASLLGRPTRPLPVPTTIGELRSNFNQLRLHEVIEKEFKKAGVSLSGKENIEVLNFEKIKNVTEFLTTTDAVTVYNYLGLTLALDLAKHASTNSEIAPHRANLPRAEECASLLFKEMKDVVGHLYARKHLPREAKYEVDDIFIRLKNAFIKALERFDWMDSDTKQAVQRRIENLAAKIAYPSWVLNVKTLEERYHKMPDLKLDTSFVKMMHQLKMAKDRMNFMKLNTPYDKSSDWGFSPSPVHAFYSLTGNELVFPMGGLQSPFYRYGLPKSLNVGSIGAVIGHEITHSFIGKGAYYNGGRPGLLWSGDTFVKFHQKAACFVQQYGNILDKDSTMQLNGSTTLYENIADNLGLEIAIKVYDQLLKSCKKPAAELYGLEGRSGKQLLLLGYAMAWCEVKSAEEQRKKILRDEHSPNRHRVNIPTHNLEAIPAAFSCQRPSSTDPVSKEKCKLLSP